MLPGLAMLGVSLAGFGQSNLAPADETTNDVALGLAKCVVRKATGITLALVPAGEFLMGSGAT